MTTQKIRNRSQSSTGTLHWRERQGQGCNIPFQVNDNKAKGWEQRVTYTAPWVKVEVSSGEKMTKSRAQRVLQLGVDEMSQNTVHRAWRRLTYPLELQDFRGKNESGLSLVDYHEAYQHLSKYAKLTRKDIINDTEKKIEENIIDETDQGE